MSGKTNTLQTPTGMENRSTTPVLPTIIGVPTPSSGGSHSTTTPLVENQSLPTADIRIESQAVGEFLQPGDKVGRYSIVRSLGRGGMGAVYEAHDTRLDRKVALKTLVGSLVGRPEAARRFAIEAQAAARLAHPNVVAIYDCDTEGPIPYLAMELMQGEPLSALIHRGRLSPEQVADVVLGVCAGVQAAHDAGIVHRDLKPSNIFLATDWNGQTRSRVLDFGISKIKDVSNGGLTETGDILGTSQYLSPEQAAGDLNADGRSDQYSIGVVMYEAVTQRTPHQGEPIYSLIRNVVEGRWLPPRTYAQDLDPAFEAIITRAMRLLPADRFPSVFDLGLAVFPFASAKVQRQYADYFNGAGSASSGTARSPLPAAGQPDANPALQATAVLPQTGIPTWQAQATHTALPQSDAFLARGEVPSVVMSMQGSEGPSSFRYVARQSSRRLIVLMGIGAVVILAALTLVFFSTKHSPATTPAPPIGVRASTARNAPPAPVVQTPPAQPPQSTPEHSQPAVEKPVVVPPSQNSPRSDDNGKIKGTKARNRLTPRGMPIL